MNSLYIAARVRKVIEHLLHAQEDISVKKVAEMLGVSERTIHRDLKSVEQLIFDHNLELVKKAGVGLRIIGDERDKQQLESQLVSRITSEFTPEERQSLILSSLFETNEPIKLFALANELHVTIATISNDLDQLEEELATYHLELIRRRGYGVKIEGNETDKRSAISQLITKYVDPFEFVSLLKENIQKKSEHPLNAISNRLLGLVNPEKLSIIEKRVDEARDELPHDLADSAYIGLVVHLALAMERLRKGENITFDQAYLKQIEGTKEYEIAEKVIRDLEVSLNMTIPEDEIGYITMHLMGAKLRIDQHYLIEDSSIDIAYKAKQLINFISTELDTDVTENATLLKDLVAHLKPTIYRLKQGMTIKNPMIEEIKRNYDDLFQLIKEGVRETFPDMDFPDDEIGYLVLHFAAALLHDEKESDIQALVICSSGIGTAKILATKLMQNVSEIKYVENKSMFDLNKADTVAYDIIVSTVPLKGFDREYIVASPMLTQAEVQQVEKAIRQKKLVRNPRVAGKQKQEEVARTDFLSQLEATQINSKIIVELLKAFYVRQISGKQTMESILREICTESEESQVVINKENVFEKLLKREQISGLGIPNTSLALYHTRSNDVVKPSFTIYSLDHPLTVQGMDGDEVVMEKVLIMLAPEDTQAEVLEVLSFLSSLIIQSQESMKLFESGNEAQIRNFLSEQFHTFLHEKNLL
ncbi:BglG family transcription antiterminator [Virgibacillus necropolis]|uniref:BglG family transcription antiterminator n=1 Tax=Virgibacillus necropolis TaxID=163877 RepID=UPI00384CBE07